MPETREFDLYFVAFYKHDAPQCLLEGPFIDEEAARIHIAERKSPLRCVVKTTLPFEVVE